MAEAHRWAKSFRRVRSCAAELPAARPGQVRRDARELFNGPASGVDDPPSPPGARKLSQQTPAVPLGGRGFMAP